MIERIKAAIIAQEDKVENKAKKLSRQLSFPMITAEQVQDFDWILQINSLGLTLCPTQNHQVKPFWVDFSSSAIQQRLRTTGKRSPLARAVGLKPKIPMTLIDATAGFGRDSLLLANLGIQITMLEQTPLVSVLLEDGLQRVAKDPQLSHITSSMQLIAMEASAYFAALKPVNYPDVVYLDPMFGPRKKHALVKKSMQLLQQLVCAPTDPELLFNAALRVAKKRVVIKRPAGALAFTVAPPSFRIKTPTIRFDVYQSRQVSP